VGPLGFLLNDEMDDFAAKPGVPNLYGLVQGVANAVGPNKRPLSAMTPTIVLKEGKLWLVLGAEGGPTIITNVAKHARRSRRLRFGHPGGSECARVHQQWLPDRIELELRRISPDTIRLLQAAGNRMVPVEILGDSECIEIDLVSGERLGASDARNENGRALGY